MSAIDDRVTQMGKRDDGTPKVGARLTPDINLGNGVVVAGFAGNDEFQGALLVELPGAGVWTLADQAHLFR